MGLKYSSDDSANLIQAMKSNLTLANQVTDRLSSGCDHLLSVLDSGELTGAAYTAGRELFSEVIIPSIKKLQAAIDDIEAELGSYEYADSVVSEYGKLDSDYLQDQIDLRLEQLGAVEDQLEENQKFSTQFQAFVTGNLEALTGQTAALKEMKRQIEIGIEDLETRLKKLEWFAQDVSQYFSDSLEVLQLAISGATALGRITVDAEGHYYSNDANMDWLTKLKNGQIRTYDRGKDPKVSLVEEQAEALMLPEEAAVYYRQQVLALLEGRPAGDWPIIIQAVNESLTFDEEGNILEIMGVNLGAGDGYIVMKNGQYDASLTQQANAEANRNFLESLGENALQILAGLLETITGSIGLIGSFTLGAGGTLVSALPTGGTATVPITAASAVIIGGSTYVLEQGTSALVDGLTKVAEANSKLELSFAQDYDGWKANQPTSQTIRGGMSGRVGGKKLNNIRVDIEPRSGDGGKIQVQSGSGKSGYDLDLHIDVSDIKSKQDIIDWVKKQGQLKNLKPGEMQKIIRLVRKLSRLKIDNTTD